MTDTQPGPAAGPLPRREPLRFPDEHLHRRRAPIPATETTSVHPGGLRVRRRGRSGWTPMAVARRAGGAGWPGGPRRPRRRDAGGFGGSGAVLLPFRRGPRLAARSPRRQRCPFSPAVGPNRSRGWPRCPGWRTPRSGHPASGPPGGASPLTPARSSSAEGQYSSPVAAAWLVREYFVP